MSLVMIPASAVTDLTGEYQFNTSSDPLAAYAINSNTASGSSGVQANSYAPAGKGIFGYSDASGAPGFGVAGISQNGYGVYGSSYGTGITAIYGENLSGGGIGIQGASSGGTGMYGVGAQNGVEGQTNNSTSGTTYAGVYGIDNSSGSNVVGYGVYGTSVHNAGVYGFASGSNGVGVLAVGQTAVLGMGTAGGGEFGGYSGSPSGPALQSFDTVGGTDLLATYTYHNVSGKFHRPGRHGEQQWRRHVHRRERRANQRRCLRRRSRLHGVRHVPRDFDGQLWFWSRCRASQFDRRETSDVHRAAKRRHDRRLG
jgi:hypothetical protein